MTTRPIYKPKGAADQLMKAHQCPRCNGIGKGCARCKETGLRGGIQEILIEGAAGTGKSVAVMNWIDSICESYPGTKVLMVRKVLNSMRTSILPSWENYVLGPGHPAIQGKATVMTRVDYRYPNGSWCVPAGLDNPNKIMSSEWHIIACFEATDLEERDWEQLMTRLERSVYNWKPPFCQIIADCNPGRASHWLNKRFSAEGQQLHGRIRLFSKHEDNPSLHPDYLLKLSQLSGARRDRLYLGKWVSEEGLVFPEFQTSVHVIPPEKVPEIDWYFAAQDWGHNAAGVLQVWGVDHDKRMYRVKEIYRTGQTLDWWADKAEWFYKQYKLKAIVCDPSRPESIQTYNERLGSRSGRDAFGIAQGALNDRTIGLDQIRWALQSDGIGPRMYFVSDALVGVDSELQERDLPTCTEEEFEDYIYRSFDPEKMDPDQRDEPDKRCEDHGIDATRYASMFLWRTGGGLTGSHGKVPRIKPGTWADVLGHKRVWTPDDKPKGRLEWLQ